MTSTIPLTVEGTSASLLVFVLVLVLFIAQFLLRGGGFKTQAQHLVN